MSKIETPGWVRDAVFYQIFPDRFARSDAVVKPAHLEAWEAPPTHIGFKGGDLMGVVERLDYLTDLGVNAIYFNPIFQSAANHRYHTHDYYRVDPLLGGDAAFDRLIDRAHTRGIRVVLDGVFNHSSRGFFQFNHILENGPNSPYVDWFHVFEYPVNAYDHSNAPRYSAWWNLHALPKFNTANPQVRDFLLDVATYWVERGIDGWRLDVPNEIEDDDFWRTFRDRVKGVNPDAYICGEIWGDARRWLQGDMFDAVMNYPFTKAAIGFFAGDRMEEALVRGVGYYPIPALDAPAMARAIDALLDRYPTEITQVQLNLLGSHDTARFLSVADGDTRALELATLFQMCYPGAPCIYYGDEIGMTGGRDPGCRYAFPWNDRASWDESLLTFTRRATALRDAHVSLRRGSFQTRHAEGKSWLYERAHEDERLLVAFNAGDTPATVSLRLEATRLAPLFGDPPALSPRGGEFRIELPPRSGFVWGMEG